MTEAVGHSTSHGLLGRSPASRLGLAEGDRRSIGCRRCRYATRLREEGTTGLKGRRLDTNHVTGASLASNTRKCLAEALAAVKQAMAWRDSWKECISVSIDLHHVFPGHKRATDRESTPETTGADLFPMFALETVQHKTDRLSE